jgi:hypothetical protein
MEFSIGDTVEVCLKDSIYTDCWDGLVGEIEATLYSRLYRIRFTDPVPRKPHSDPYVLQLSAPKLKLVYREPDWEV